MQTHRDRETLVLLADKSFGQDVGSLLLCRDVLKTDLFTLDFLPQKMMSDFDVLCAVVELRVVCDGDRGLVIDMECGW
jgi:hypothetical protein